MSRAEAWVRRTIEAPARRPDPPVRLSASAASIDDGLRELEVMLEFGIHGKTRLGTLTETADGLTLEPDSSLGVDAATLRSLAVGNVFIPETILVALAAIHEYEPAWIEREPEFASMRAKGQGVGALMDMTTSFTLSEAGEGTSMAWEADVKIAGPVGAMGQRVLQPIVNQQVSQVLEALEKRVAATS